MNLMLHSYSYFQRWNTDAARNITGMTFTATQVDGQCHAPEGDATKPLACAPKHKGPPKEAIDACASKADGDACSFKNAEGKEHSGTCKAHHKDPGKPLACMTKHHKDKHEGKEGKE